VKKVIVLKIVLQSRIQILKPVLQRVLLRNKNKNKTLRTNNPSSNREEEIPQIHQNWFAIIAGVRITH